MFEGSVSQSESNVLGDANGTEEQMAQEGAGLF
jgi:hypothetical protein